MDDRLVAAGRENLVRHLDVLLDPGDPAPDDLVPTDPGLGEGRHRVEGILREQRRDVARNVRDPGGPVRLRPTLDPAPIHESRVRDEYHVVLERFQATSYPHRDIPRRPGLSFPGPDGTSVPIV
jgi:hypothetical protein